MQRPLRKRLGNLISARGALPVVVEARLTDGPDDWIGGQGADLGRRPIIEALGRVRMAADRGKYPIELPGRLDRGVIGVRVHADGQDPPDSGPLGGLDELVVRRVA